MDKKKSKNYWVVPANDGGWDVKREGAARASNHFGTQREADVRARELAKKSGGERITVGLDGKIRSKDSYGNDPKSQVDREH